MDQNNAATTQREAEWRERRNKRQKGTAASSSAPGTTATKKPFASSARWQRAQWAVVMCLPCFLLFFLRLLSKEGSLKNIHILDTWLALPLDASTIQTDMTSTIYATCALLSSIIVAINELKGNSRIPVYFYVFTCAMSWGSCIDLLEDLVLARLCCMGVFGIGAGQLWFLWDRHIAKKKLHYQRLERKRAENILIKGGVGGLVDDGVHNASSQSDEGGPTSGPEAIITTATISPPNNNNGEDSAPVSPLWKTMQPQPPSGQEIAHSLWGKMGLAALWSLGEVLGCLMFVNHSYQFIGSSLLGYPLLVIFPILCARAAMGLSWVLTLLVGKSHAYSATILRALHVVFTVLVLVILLGGFIKCISHYLPWVWSLQKLVGPYCLVIENISYNSRKYHSKNPYKGFVDQHRDSIAHFFTKGGKAAH